MICVYMHATIHEEQNENKKRNDLPPKLILIIIHDTFSLQGVTP